MTSRSRPHETTVSVLAHSSKMMLSPHLNNRSATSITSEAATFHSAQAAVEMEQDKTSIPTRKPEPELPPTTMMSRTDSGYEPGHERRSTSISSSRSRRPRHSTSSTSPRPTTKRTSRSSQSSSLHRTSPRPSLQCRYTTPRGHQEQSESQTPYQFFHFPSFAPPTPPTSSSEVQPPPATVHYFLLPETRRLEYAAIDAASRGVRGFVTKLLPDCILPSEYRRTKFHNEADQDSDVGSVRRYRLAFPDPEEKGITHESSRWRSGSAAAAAREVRPALWRRVLSLGK